MITAVIGIVSAYKFVAGYSDAKGGFCAILAALGLKAIVVPIEEPRIVATARSDASRNAISAHVKLKDNSLSGGSGTLKSTMVSGEITLAEQLRKEPARAWRNFNANAVGCGPDIAQIGGHN